MLQLSKDIPHKANLKELLVIISNAMYIKNYLHHVETVLSAEDNGYGYFYNLLLYKSHKLRHNLKRRDIRCRCRSIQFTY